MKIPPHIILPDSGQELLRHELALAFTTAGFRVTRAHPLALQGNAVPDAQAHKHPHLTYQTLETLLQDEPALLLSVNFQGLGNLKQTLELLEQHKSAAAVWCVDNPWNLLAGVRDPRWRTVPMFVTDASFVPALQRNGGEKVFHLPLAASFALFAPDVRRDAAFPPPKDLAPFVFVGRSAFPGKDTFFAGQSVPEPLTQQALQLLEAGERPDLLWWENALQQDVATFWPGKKARQSALGAEESNLAWRSACLANAATAGNIMAKTPRGTGLDIFGDAGWQAFLPQHARLQPAVDYYARLPALYAAAQFSVCLTSLQLPQGLNQRHFDVWATGGVCLTDNTPGLSLFPLELTRPVTFTKPQDMGIVAEALEASGARKRLVADWQQHLREKHTYEHRVQTIMRHVYPAS